MFTLYLSFSKPSKSMLFAQLRPIQTAIHMMDGTAAIQTVSVARLCRMIPSRNTTPAKRPFRAGRKRIGPSSGFDGRMLCLSGRKYAVYAVWAKDVMARSEICDGKMMNIIVGISDRTAKNCFLLTLILSTRPNTLKRSLDCVF